MTRPLPIRGRPVRGRSPHPVRTYGPEPDDPLQNEAKELIFTSTGIRAVAARGLSGYAMKDRIVVGQMLCMIHCMTKLFSTTMAKQPLVRLYIGNNFHRYQLHIVFVRIPGYEEKVYIVPSARFGKMNVNSSLYIPVGNQHTHEKMELWNEFLNAYHNFLPE